MASMDSYELDAQRQDMAVAIATSVSFGAYLPVVSLCIYRIWSKQVKARAHWLHIAIIVVTAVMTLVYTVGIWTQKLSGMSSATYNMTNALIYLGGNGTFVGLGIIYVVCDILVVWRAVALYAEWGNNLRFAAGTVIFGFLSITLVEFINVNLNFLNLVSEQWLIFVCSGVSILINGIATFGVLYKAKAYLTRTAFRNTKAVKAIIVMGESGLVYLVLQIVCFALSIKRILSRSFGHGEEIVLSILPILAAMYPAIVVLLVSHQLSLEHHVEKARVYSTAAPHASDSSV